MDTRETTAQRSSHTPRLPQLLLTLVAVLVVGTELSSQPKLIWSAFNAGSQQSVSTTIVLVSFVGQPLSGSSSGNGISLLSGPVASTIASTVTSVSSRQDGLIPSALRLEQNFPNPFNPATNIEFSVPEDGRVTLKIYNMLGQLVATPFDGDALAGLAIRVSFDATSLAAGFYISRMDFGGKQLTRKMLLVK